MNELPKEYEKSINVFSLSHPSISEGRVATDDAY